MVTTMEKLIAAHGVEIDEHLSREVEIPVLSGLQFQGDVAVVPAPKAKAATKPVPREGFPVVRGENGGNTHLLLAEGPVFFDQAATVDAQNLTLGVLTVPEGSVAHLAHPEHGYASIAPGSYTIRRQREEAEVSRLVAD